MPLVLIHKSPFFILLVQLHIRDLKTKTPSKLTSTATPKGEKKCQTAKYITKCHYLFFFFSFFLSLKWEIWIVHVIAVQVNNRAGVWPKSSRTFYTSSRAVCFILPPSEFSPQRGGDGAPLLKTIKQHFGLAVRAGRVFTPTRSISARWVFHTEAIEYRIHPKATPVSRNWNISSRQRGGHDLSFHSKNILSHVFKNHQFKLNERRGKKKWLAAKSLQSVINFFFFSFFQKGRKLCA